MFDYIRVSSAVPALSVGNTELNTDNICKMIVQSAEKDADIVSFPELAVTGYTCGDLFFQKTLLDSAVKGIERIIESAAHNKISVIVGAPLTIDGQLYNCAVVISDGKIAGISVKTFIPNYSEFYEKRWFSSSEDITRSTVGIAELGITKFGDYDIPVGRDLVFSVGNTFKFGVEICEDIWTVLPPSTFLALGGAEILFNISASNETIAKHAYRRELVKQQSARTMSAYIYTSAGEDESTTDLVFSGHSVIAENGTILAENKETIDGNYMIVTDIDLGKIKADRLKYKTYNDSVHLYGALQKCRTVSLSAGSTRLASCGELYNVRKLPFVPDTETDRAERCLNIFRMQVAGLKKRVAVTGSKLVIGVSGGLDSTLALLVSAETMRQLGRPLTDVYGITMPCFGTSDRTFENSLELMRTLGVSSKTINIKESCIKHFEDIGHDISLLDATYENSQARERTQVLMDYASRVGGFVVGTGDLSELALGWCTYNGDQISMYGVNCSIPKTLVRWMIASIMKYNIFEESSDVLKDILDTPISPELLPPDAKGEIAQVTEDIIGPYALHDFFLYYMLRYGFEPQKIYALAKRAFKNDFDNETILKWLKTFYRRFFTQQFKRSCMPDGVKVGSICLSPRGDWRMPSDASANIWLKQIEELK